MTSFLHCCDCSGHEMTPLHNPLDQPSSAHRLPLGLAHTGSRVLAHVEAHTAWPATRIGPRNGEDRRVLTSGDRLSVACGRVATNDENHRHRSARWRPLRRCDGLTPLPAPKTTRASNDPYPRSRTLLL